MKLSVLRVLVLFAVGLAALPIIALALLVWNMNSQISGITNAEFDKIGVSGARQMAEDTIRICRIISDGQRFADGNARGAVLARLAELGPMRATGKKYTAMISNEFDLRKTMNRVSVPEIMFGSSEIDIKSDGESLRLLDSSGPVKDILMNLKGDTDMEFSIYTRLNTSGDMLKIVSTMENNSGGTRIGTYIPYEGGRDDGAIVRALLNKETYTGVFYVGRTGYLMTYEPLLNSDGRVTGAISYGRPQSSFDYVLKYFEGMRIGANGYVWGVDMPRPGESVVRVSKDGKMNGSVIEKDTREERRDATLEIVRSAVAAGDGKISVKGFKMGGDSSAGDDVIIAYTYFKPWNMVFCATVFRSDFASGVANINKASDRFMFMLLPLALAMLILAGLAARFAASRAVGVIYELSTSANLIKFGDITAARRTLHVTTSSRKWSYKEIHNLALSLKKMSVSLSGLVSKVQSEGVDLANGVEKIASGALELGTVADARSNAIREVSDTVGSMAKSVEMLNAEARDAGASVDVLLSYMNDSGGSVGRLSDNALGILSATESVALRLALILENTEDMVAAVGTINAVSDRTSMLSLNASLEAERAGEFGEGFALVSSEIGRLADRSALSAMRVSKMVSRMRESVESGLSEMELFSTQMRESLRTIKMLSESLDAAKAQVAELGAEFDSLAHGVSAQSESAIKISVSVHELNSAAFQTRNKAGDLKIVTDALEKTSFELKAKVSQFKLPPDNKGA